VCAQADARGCLGMQLSADFFECRDTSQKDEKISVCSAAHVRTHPVTAQWNGIYSRT